MSLQVFQDDDLSSSNTINDPVQQIVKNSSSSDGAAKGSNDFAWENKKENFKPRAKGRDVRKLNAFGESSLSAGGAADPRKLRLEEQKQAFENAIANYEGTDPIRTWLKYIKWAETEFPNSSAKAMPLYERCTRALFKVEKYRNNLKYLSVWLKFADELDDSTEVFRFLYSNKIGQDLSFFYVAWALVEEEKNRYSLADKIYCRGIALKAEPEKDLEVRHNQFKRRMSRHWLKRSDGEDAVQSHAPSESEPGDENSRGAFSMLTSEGAGTSRRAPAGGRVNANTGRRSGNVTGGGLQSAAGRNVRKPKNQVNTLGNFQIFVEEGFREDQAGAGGAQQQEDELLKESAAPWDDFGTVAERKKENTMGVSAWNEGGLYEEKGIKSIRPKNPPAGAGFAVCVDDQFDGGAEPEEHGENSEVDAFLAPSAKKVTLRRRLEGSATRTPEEQEALELKINPFKNYDQMFSMDSQDTIESELLDSPKKAAVSREQKSAPKQPVKGMKNLMPAKVTRKKSSKAEVVSGYDESLLKGDDGNEACFQEARGMAWLQRRNKRRESERLALEEQERRAALCQRELQTSADDIVTELRRNPNAARRGGGGGRRATISTITPNLRPLHDGFSSGGSSGGQSAAEESSVWSDNGPPSTGFGKKNSQPVKSTATKMLTFGDSATKTDTVNTATKVLQFGSFDNSVEETPMAGKKQAAAPQPATASRRLFFSTASSGGRVPQVDAEDMTQNMKEAMETIGGLFQSSPINEHNHDTTTAMSSIRFLDGKANLLGETRGVDDTFGEDEQNGGDNEDMTMNMKAAIQDLGDLFCSPGQEGDAVAAETVADYEEEQPTKFLIFKDGEQNDTAKVGAGSENQASAAPFQVHEDVSILSNPNATATGTINFGIFDENEGNDRKMPAAADENATAVLANVGSTAAIRDQLFQMIDEDDEDEDEEHDESVYNVNGENITPPRGLSSRGRRVRSLETLSSDDVILGELPIPEEYGSDGGEGENDEENDVDVPIVQRLTTRASSPLALSQPTNEDAPPSNVNLHNAPEEVELLVPVLVRDFSDPKYNFEVFEDSTVAPQQLPMATEEMATEEGGDDSVDEIAAMFAGGELELY